MTPKQALDLLAQATGLLQLKREDHQAILKALEVLSGLIHEEDDLSDSKKK